MPASAGGFAEVCQCWQKSEFLCLVRIIYLDFISVFEYNRKTSEVKIQDFDSSKWTTLPNELNLPEADGYEA